MASRVKRSGKRARARVNRTSPAVPSDKELNAIAQKVAGRAESETVERPVPGEFYEARWPITYGPPAGEPGNTLHLSPGQVFKLAGYPNDEKLVRLGYLAKVTKASMPSGKPFPCRKCGAFFTTERGRDKHGYEKHEQASLRNPHLQRLYDRTQELLSMGRRLNLHEELELKQLREAATAWDEQREERPYQEASTQAPLHMERTAASMR